MIDTAEKPADFVEALAKGLAILEAFDAAHPDMTLSEVARRVGLSPAAARRSLITLTSLGYVGQFRKRFHLKTEVMALGSGFHFSARIDAILRPELRSLVAQFGDAASVGTLSRGEVIYVAHYSVQKARRAMAHVGAKYPAYATSMGKVLLAALPRADLDTYLARYDPLPLTSATITDPDVLRAELTEVRAQGYATTADQLDYGITALAVPIRGADGTTIATLNTSGYTGKVTPAQLVEERLPDLRVTALTIEDELARFPVIQSMLAY